MVSCGLVRCAAAKARTFDSVTWSSRSKIALKTRVCCSHDASLVSAASGESDLGGSPARNRAVSSAVASSAPRAGVNPSARSPASRAAMRLATVEIIQFQGYRLGWIRRGESRVELRHIVEQQPGQHYGDARERLQRSRDDEIVHDEQGDDQKHYGRNGISPGAVGAHRSRRADSHLDHAEHSEERAEREA